jgi:hypothetical protein
MPARQLETSELKKLPISKKFGIRSVTLTLFLRVFRGLYTAVGTDERRIVRECGKNDYGCSSDNIVTVRTELGLAF